MKHAGTLHHTLTNGAQYVSAGPVWHQHLRGYGSPTFGATVSYICHPISPSDTTYRTGCAGTQLRCGLLYSTCAAVIVSGGDVVYK